MTKDQHFTSLILEGYWNTKYYYCTPISMCWLEMSGGFFNNHLRTVCNALLFGRVYCLLKYSGSYWSVNPHQSESSLIGIYYIIYVWSNQWDIWNLRCTMVIVDIYTSNYYNCISYFFRYLDGWLLVACY